MPDAPFSVCLNAPPAARKILIKEVKKPESRQSPLVSLLPPATPHSSRPSATSPSEGVLRGALPRLVLSAPLLSDGRAAGGRAVQGWHQAPHMDGVNKASCHASYTLTRLSITSPGLRGTPGPRTHRHVKVTRRHCTVFVFCDGFSLLSTLSPPRETLQLN